MRFLKFLLVLALIVFTLASYKIIIFDNGVEFIDSTMWKNELLFDAKAVYYYKNPLNFSADKTADYIVIIDTDNYGNILIRASQDDIDSATALDNVLSQSGIIRRISPIQWWLFLILFVVILLIPVKRHKKPEKA